ncbi:MAG: hypothetical protein JO020_11425 [Chloroflexi bacterium]|nr:hypothetical protein [Chloroflexota bacterium]MBV9131597.1 hypothetical protein [Chloroflexota bacterium]MBV9894771.1 hypothetical protein [Chloroflexota bacterium]
MQTCATGCPTDASDEAESVLVYGSTPAPAADTLRALDTHAEPRRGKSKLDASVVSSFCLKVSIIARGNQLRWDSESRKADGECCHGWDSIYQNASELDISRSTLKVASRDTRFDCLAYQQA